ncbi:serine/threonine-protein kinase [Saccharopolyspora cebuensis]|uniref:non-specific serine/threonine protein kinase n=1 Tax=Saccharopolyspora cebuensis TaxID=418759 RepID=A0ABV4CF76_9PSEU
MPTEAPDNDHGSERLIAERYRLETRLGGGAMGTVWSGVDELLRRPVAVKEIRLAPGMPEAQAAELRERALREARAIAVLTHPNVVTLYDVAREDGEPFVVMELVPSQSLATVLTEHGALEDHELAVIVDGVAAALEAAHRAGIVHRDVKPGNVLIGDDGRIKLSDFGISRDISEHTITATGILLGTPAFIAPEIAAGEPVTTAADLWGLGATLFAAAAGRAPYDVDDNPLDTITEVVRGPVPDAERSGPIGEVIAGLMVKEPAARMPLTEVRKRLQHLLPEHGSRPLAMLLDPDAPTVRVRRPAPEADRQSTAHDAPLAAEPLAAAPLAAEPLAADPGALPFELRDARPDRSRWRTAALVLAALVLFGAAAVAGFAGTRLAAGAPLLPAERSGVPAEAGVSLPALAPYTDDTDHTGDDGRGEFVVMAPAGWTTFHSERLELVNSKRVSLVSPDGRTEMSVQRFGGLFAAGHTAEDYFEALPALSPGDSFEVPRMPANPYDTAVYRYGSPAEGFARTTAMRLVRHGDDLWALRVTTPPELQKRAESLLAAVLPGFRPMG